MNLQINGKIETLTNELTLKDLLDQKGINANLVACELNMKIIKRAELASVSLRDGDELEIIQMIGGG